MQYHNHKGQTSKLKCQTPLAIPQGFKKQFATMISVTTSRFMGFQRPHELHLSVNFLNKEGDDIATAI